MHASKVLKRRERRLGSVSGRNAPTGRRFARRIVARATASCGRVEEGPVARGIRAVVVGARSGWRLPHMQGMAWADAAGGGRRRRGRLMGHECRRRHEWHLWLWRKGGLRTLLGLLLMLRCWPWNCWWCWTSW